MAAFVSGPSRPHLALRLRVAWLQWRLDRELAAGVDPHSSDAHALRAEQLTQPRRRKRLARALRRAAAGGGASRGARVPVSRAAVLEAQPALLALADDLAETPEPSARGVALALSLLSDGGGPLYRPWTPSELYTAAEDARHAL